MKCHELRKKPIGDLTVEELRLLVLQQIGLPFLVPVALAIVERTPLAEGDCYPGDLLNSLLHADVAFWQTHPAWRDHLAEVLMGLPSVPEELTSVAETFLWAR